MKRKTQITILIAFMTIGWLFFVFRPTIIDDGPIIKSPCRDGVPRAASGQCYHLKHEVVVKEGAVLCLCPD